MKKGLLFLLIFFLTTQPFSATTSPAIPPLPSPDQHTQQTAIFMLEKELPKNEIIQLIQKYRNIQIRDIYTLALDGFSAKGPVKDLEKLAKEPIITGYTPVTPYKAETLYQKGDNFHIIGGDQVRSLYDESKQRLTGKGVKIGIIDTGVDYHHDDLRKNYGGGHDAVDGDNDPMETKNNTGLNTFHGTHVAGIIAANGRMKGIAPEATIMAYRALGPGGMGTTEQVVAAIEQAIKDKVDILNLSLGNNVNGPDLPLSVALNNAVDHGITAVTSSGNSGPNVWTVGSPGTASKAIAVGASTPTMKIPYIETGGESFRLQPLQGSIDWDLDRSYEIVTGGIGRQKQLTNVQGKIALIKRGELTFTEKVQHAEKAGAIAVIIYNNTKGSFMGNLLHTSTIPVMTLSKQDGERLKEKIEQGRTLIKTNIIEEKDRLADFSSRGPVTATWEIKPDILAPGVAINSTIPGGYLPLDGTSMAAPHVAGACALIKQAHPDWGPEKIKAALMNYAKPLYDRNNDPYRTYEQGAGRIQVKESIEADVLVYPSSLRFGKYQLSETIHEHQAKITIENLSSEQKEISFDLPKQQEGINWNIPIKTKLETGEKRDFIIKISVDPRRIKEKIQDGFLTIKKDGESISVPYIFVLEEPDYPRVMGFDFGAGDKEGTYRYEAYLPSGAEEFGIALFHSDTYQFIQFLDWKRDTGKGLIQGELHKDQLPPDGMYVAKVFARKSGKEDWIESLIQIGANQSP